MFCTKLLFDNRLRKNKDFVWEVPSRDKKTWYEIHSKIIYYKERKVILEISYDITDKKKDEKQILNFFNYQNIISNVAKIFTTDIQFDKKLDKSIQSIGKSLNLNSIVILQKINNYRKHLDIY